MRKPIAVLICTLLCLSALAGCGTITGMPNPDAPVFGENAPPTTDTGATATTTQETSTTEKESLSTAQAIQTLKSTTTTTHFKNVGPPPRLLSYKMDENGIFYTESPTWQEHLIEGSSEQMVYGTVYAKFQYDQKDWLIQMLKGRYGLVMLGSEICISPQEELVFKMDVYQHNFLTGKTTYLFTRGPESAVWFNGFVPGKFFEDGRKDEIIVVGSITFPDAEMLHAFEAPFAAAGFKKGSPSKTNPEKYSINGTTLTFSWQYIDQDA